MRINCVFGPYFPVPALLGGAVEKIFHALCVEWARHGHQVTLISRRYSGLAEDETIDGVRYLRIESRDRPASRATYLLHDLVYAGRVRRALPASDVTVTHSTTLPLLLSKRHVGRMYVSVGRFPKRQMALYRRADRLQAVSEPVAAAIRHQSPAVAHLVRMLPNTLTSAFAAEAAIPVAPKKRQILYVGRIAREKGIDVLIRAFRLIADDHPDWRLVVVGPWASNQGGDGAELLDELRALAGSARVEFVDPVFDEAALLDRYLAAAIFAYPSLAAQGESFGMAPLEAMACGNAPIVSDLPCFRDFLIPGENGEVFDHRDPTGAPLAAALKRLMTSDKLCERIAARAKETSRRYTPSAVAKLFLDDFAMLTGLPATR